MRRSGVNESLLGIKGVSASGVIGADSGPDRGESMHPSRWPRAARCIHRDGRIHL